MVLYIILCFCFKQKTAYEMRISDWSSDVCSSDLSTGSNRMKGDAGQATLDNILDVTEKLAFIQRLDLPHDLLTATGKPWVDQIVRRVAGEIGRASCRERVCQYV